MLHIHTLPHTCSVAPPPPKIDSYDSTLNTDMYIHYIIYTWFQTDTKRSLTHSGLSNFLNGVKLNTCKSY